MKVLLVTTSGRFVGRRESMASRLVALIMAPYLDIFQTEDQQEKSVLLQIVGIVFSKAVAVDQVCVECVVAERSASIMNGVLRIDEIPSC